MVEDNMEVDVFLLLALACLMLLSEIVHVLIKFFQKRNLFVCGYVATIKVCKSQLYSLFQIHVMSLMLSKTSRIWLLQSIILLVSVG
jgi:hypothetical protein